MPIYEESILLELKAYNALLYSLMHDSAEGIFFRGYPLVWRCRILSSQMEKEAGAFTDSGENFLVSAAG